MTEFQMIFFNLPRFLTQGSESKQCRLGSDCSSKRLELVSVYRKVPKFWDPRNVCCNLPKIQTKRPSRKIFCQNGADGIANSEDTDQTAPIGAV